MIVILGLGILSLYVLTNARKLDEDTFCTLEDEVYQTIAVQHQEWIEHYRPLLASTGFASPELIFNLENGKGYSVDASVWRSVDDLPRFFVVTEIGWQERFGTRGYFFSPIGMPSIERLRFQRLDGNVYCYWFD